MTPQPWTSALGLAGRWAWLVAAVVAVAALGYLLLQLPSIASTEQAQLDTRGEFRDLTLEMIATVVEVRASGDDSELDTLLAGYGARIDALVAGVPAQLRTERVTELLDRLVVRFAELREVARAFATGEAPRSRLDEAFILLARDGDAATAAVAELEIDTVNELRLLLAVALAASALAVLGGVGGWRRYRRRQAARYAVVSEALSESEQWLRHEQAAAGLASWSVNVATGEGWWSDERYRLLGLEPGSVKPSLEAHLRGVHPDDRDRVERTAHAIVAGDDFPSPLVYRVCHPDGAVRTVEAHHTADRDEHGRLLRIWGTTLDITERVQREEALRLSEAELARAQRVARVGNWSWEPDKDEMTWSREALRLVGVPLDGPLPTRSSAYRIVHPDDRARVMEENEKAWSEGGERRYECRIVLPDGRERTIQTTVEGTRDDAGVPRRIFGTVQDVTERAAAEAALRESEERARRIMETARDAFIAIDADGAVTEWNPQAADTFGWSRSEAVGRSLKELVIPERHRDGHERGLRHFLVTGQGPVLNTRIEIDALHRDGHEFPVELSIWPLKVDGTHVFNAFIRDITERKRAENALRESEESLARSQRLAHLGSWEWERATDRLTWSDEMHRILGLEPEAEPRSETLSSAIHPEDIERVQANVERARADGSPLDQEYRIVRADGAERIIHANRQPLRDKTGRLIRIIGLVQDVTEQRALEQQLLQAQKSEALGTLVAGVAHDFNNLLTAIGGSLYLASSRPEQRERWLQRAEESTNRAADLVRQLLQFSRREERRRSAVDLAELGGDAVRLAAETFDRRVVLRLDAPQRHLAWGDRSQLELVLMNLMINARDAVLSRAEHEPSASAYRPQIVLAVREGAEAAPADDGDGWVELTVTDNGLGMSRGTRERIFDPFFTTKPAGHGTGLGLSTAYGIVGEHGGTITVESEPGEGATFTLLLPAASAERSGGDEASPPEHATGAPVQPDGPSVLLVDDEEAVLEFAAEVLTEAGYRVAAATDGEAALRANSERDFDLVVLDVNMPTLSGWQTLERLAEDPVAPPVLMISGYASEGEAAAKGAQGFLAKPFDAPALLSAVRSSLERGAPAP